MTPDERQRRQLLAGLMATSAWLATRHAAAQAPDAQAARDAARSAHFPFGPVSPVRPLPAWRVETSAGKDTSMSALVRGKVSALQLMFTGCSATCPIQGALFSQAQRQLPKASDFQLLSVSIAPLADTPQALSAWLKEFSAGPGWLGLRPQPDDLEQIFDVLTRGAELRPKGPDPHTGQVYVVNRRGELVYRTPSMPPARQIVEALTQVAASA